MVKRYKDHLKHHLNTIYTLYLRYKEHLQKSIRLEILVITLIALGCAGAIGVLSSGLLRNIGLGRYVVSSYTQSETYMQNQLVRSVDTINRLSNATLQLNLDLDFLGNILEATPDDDLLHDLLLSNISISNMPQDTLYPAYHHFIDALSSSIHRTPELFDILQEQYTQGIWTHTAVEQLLIDTLQTNDFDLTLDTFKHLYIQQILEALSSENIFASDSVVYLLDIDGNNLYGSEVVKKIDITQTILKTFSSDKVDGQLEVIYPVIFNDEGHYLYATATLKDEQTIHYTPLSGVLGVVLGIVTFIFIMIKGTSKKIRYIEYLSHCLHQIAKGDLTYHIEVQGTDELAQVAKDIGHMAYNIKQQMDERAQSEKTKNELITNVAHDLRTPLTSILGYIALIKDQKALSPEETQKYLHIAFSKSQKLKILMEDLFEYTKLSNGTVDLKYTQISISTLLNQLVDELLPLAEARNIHLKTYVQTEDSLVCLDIVKMTRVFENLIENAIKYSHSGSTVQIILQSKGNILYTTVRNKVETMEEADLEKLFDRFYRTDASRNSETGGSGLGLAIAKSIVTMHGGKIWAQLDDQILAITVKLSQS